MPWAKTSNAEAREVARMWEAGAMRTAKSVFAAQDRLTQPAMAAAVLESIESDKGRKAWHRWLRRRANESSG